MIKRPVSCYNNPIFLAALKMPVRSSKPRTRQVPCWSECLTQLAWDSWSGQGIGQLQEKVQILPSPKGIPWELLWRMEARSWGSWHAAKIWCDECLADPCQVNQEADQRPGRDRNQTLARRPEDRPSAGALLRHPFVLRASALEERAEECEAAEALEFERAAARRERIRELESDQLRLG